MAKKRVSIKDIAEIVGVSHPTVSRALRGQGRMSDETRERILAVAQEVGYTPSLMARGLVMQRSFCVGLLLPIFSDPFHSMVAQGIEAAASQHSYSVFLASTDIDPQQEWEVARSFISRQVDGIIVSSSWVGDRYTELIQEMGVPVVLVNPMVSSQEVHSVCHDDYHGGCQLIQHLIAQEHTRIAYLTNQRAGLSSTVRQQAWQDTLHTADLDASLEYCSKAGGIQGGIEGVDALLQRADALWQQPPDAIYCYNDMMALGVLSVLRERKISVPEQIAVTGFDDLDVAGIFDPPLTTIRQPRYELGVQALHLLLRLIDAEPAPNKPDSSQSEQSQSNAERQKQSIPRSISMPGELVIRRSA